MGFIINLFPLNIFPLILVVLRDKGVIPKDLIGDYSFLALIASLLIATLSIELIKAAMFAPKGSGAWVDFVMSLLLFIGIISYIVYTFAALKQTPSILYLLVLEAQFFDLLVGFYITITNARRDFNTGG